MKGEMIFMFTFSYEKNDVENIKTKPVKTPQDYARIKEVENKIIDIINESELKTSDFDILIANLQRKERDPVLKLMKNNI